MARRTCTQISLPGAYGTCWSANKKLTMRSYDFRFARDPGSTPDGAHLRDADNPSK